MLRIALPNKGRLADDARALLNDAGLEVRVHGDRALSACVGGGIFEAIFVRAGDIPEFVADGAADLGITGWDITLESQRPVESVLDLGFGRCRLAVAATEDSHLRSIGDVPQGARVATTFPRVTASYFANAGIDVTIVPVSGAVEIAPHLGVADIVADLVSTGSTLRVNGLREIATIVDSSARLIVANETADAVRATSAATQIIRELIDALASVTRARGQRYVMANVPRRALDDVRRVLPGINGPTVTDVLDGGDHVAVHAVVASTALFRTIADLRTLGATGILVTRIERLVP
jgi:ATP phosphoribosyltransferase